MNKVEDQETTWSPEVAFKAFNESEKLKRQSEQLRQSVEKMAGTATVNECVVSVMQEGEKQQLKVTEYVEWLAREAGTLTQVANKFGGAAAVKEYSEKNDLA